MESPATVGYRNLSSAWHDRLAGCPARHSPWGERRARAVPKAAEGAVPVPMTPFAGSLSPSDAGRRRWVDDGGTGLVFTRGQDGAGAPLL